MEEAHYWQWEPSASSSLSLNPPENNRHRPSTQYALSSSLMVLLKTKMTLKPSLLRFQKTNMCNCKLKEQSRYQEQDKKRSSWSNLKTTTKKKNLKNYMKKIKKGCVHCIDTPCKVELCVEPLLCNNAL